MTNELNVTSARYWLNENGDANEGIIAVIDGIIMHVPICSGNIHYDEIMRQVNAGTLTIQDAD